ncbi:MAG: spore protease YyaC [Clostridiales bacterium]|nr:spore protease YyaC [Clostridiales bacterium]
MTRQQTALSNLIFLCIGTDKIIGDCLGPLVGAKLLDMDCPFPIYGTLQSPVHAANLSLITKKINDSYQHPYLIAVDAAVGSSKNIGYISLSRSPLSPGKGIERPLSPVGHLSVTGIVGDAALAVEQSLTYTSLYRVNRMADFIAEGIMDMRYEV